MEQQKEENRIAVEWEGPFSLDDAKGKKAGGDLGLYQIYGFHPCYLPRVVTKGRNGRILLYVGMTRRKFGVRLPEHTWMLDDWHTSHDCQVFLGRVRDGSTTKIEDAEKLTIWWHTPPYNSSNIAKSPNLSKHGVWVKNAGNRGDLLEKYPVDESKWPSLFTD